MGTPSRKSLRLPDYDYSQPGVYFVTLCTQGRACMFGEIVDGVMVVTPVGKIVELHWLLLTEHFPNVELDAFVVMPNHFHGVLNIVDVDNIVGAGSPRPGPFLSQSGTENSSVATGGETPPLQVKTTLGHVIGYFKYQTTKIINQQRRSPGMKIWQRSYYERVLRSEDEWERVREYITLNPGRWQEDRENPTNRSVNS